MNLNNLPKPNDKVWDKKERREDTVFLTKVIFRENKDIPYVAIYLDKRIALLNEVVLLKKEKK